ncbi:unnamed protein product, partial [marine sediment metagenome]
MIKNEGKINYDVIVIGAGHAGCEAALASARNGAGTLLISINMDSIALMPYSSTVGGFGRGQLIREIDVLGGEISKNIDKNYIHMRTIVSTEDPAIETMEAVVDKRRYFLSMKEVLENQNNLYLRQGLAAGILILLIFLKSVLFFSIPLISSPVLLSIFLELFSINLFLFCSSSSDFIYESMAFFILLSSVIFTTLT